MTTFFQVKKKTLTRIADIDYRHGICSPTFVADDFSKLFLHPSIILTKDSYCIHNRWCLLSFLVLIKLYYLSVFRRHYNTTEIFIFTYFFKKTRKQYQTVDSYFTGESSCLTPLFNPQFLRITMFKSGSRLYQLNLYITNAHLTR